VGVLTADLAEIVETVWTNPTTQKRLRSFLEESAAPVASAIEQRNTQ
jgi:hypothetical protein